MRTKTIGEILVEKRHGHRLPIDELARRSKIKVKYLLALEENRFEELPAASFVKGYIRAYGRIFNFDVKSLIAMLRRDYKESPKGKLVPREFIRPILKKRQLWTPIRMVAASLVGVFVVLLAYVGLQWYNLNKPPSLEVISPTEDEFVSSQVVIEGKTTPEAVVVVNAQPVALQPDGSFSTQIYFPREGIATVTVEATDRRGKTSAVQRTVYVKF